MFGFVENTFVRSLVFLNVVTAVAFAISKSVNSFANLVGKIGFKFPEKMGMVSMPSFMHGVCIPGDGLKAMVNLCAVPFKFVGNHIVQILAIDAVLIVVAIILCIIRKRQQKASIAEAATAESIEERERAFTKMMNSFK